MVGQAHKKTESVGFRISKEKFERAKSAAQPGQSVHEWCSQQIAELLDDAHGMTRGEQLLMKEVISLRTLVVDGFKLAAAGRLNLESFNRVLNLSDQHREEIAREYFTRLGEYKKPEDGSSD